MFRLLLNPLLSLLSVIYGAGLRIDRRRGLARSVSLPRPVVSVGNLTMGGTGKTPVLIKLAQDLNARGKKVAVLTRGYQGVGRSEGPSDEVRLMERHLPGIPLGVGANRAAMATRLLETKPVDIFLLDDGFQHWPLKRNLDIVCVDATDPWGGGHLLPRGRLREPVDGLKRAGLCVITRAELVSEDELQNIRTVLRRYVKEEAILTGRFNYSLWNWANTERAGVSLARRPVAAVSGIGNPSAFEDSLRRLGAEVFPVRFMDHHSYRGRDLERAERIARAHGACVVTTEKDWVKIAPSGWNGTAEKFILKAEFIVDASSQQNWNTMLSTAAN